MNSRKTRLLRLLMFALGLALTLNPLSAQTAKRRSPRQLTSAFPLTSIKAMGSQRYTSQQIAAATGLQTGQSASENDFKRATQVLGESGAFSSVTYSFQYSGEGARLDLQVADSGQFVPVYFDNFVWFSEQELLTKLQARVPLFQGKLPLGGNLIQQVSDALQALLIESNVPGRVDYLRVGLDGGEVESLLFSVTGQTIVIGNTEFSGAGEAQLPLLQKASAKLQGLVYQRSTVVSQADKNFLPIYLAQGYLKARFSSPATKVVKQGEQESEVDITFTVDPGPQYNATDIKLSGSKVLPADQLRALIHQQPGQPANTVQLARDMEAVKKLYGTQGYMAVAIQLTPSMNDAAHTVGYQLQIQEGDVYHMGDLDIQDLDVHDRRLVTAKWTLDKGVPYDSSYPKRFVDTVLKEVLVTGEWNVSIRETPEPDDKSVDVSVKFEHKGSEL